MFWGSLSSIVPHQGELDVHLLGWIKDLLDDLLGLSDWAVVALTGAVILVIPLGLVLLYFSQRRRGSYDPAGDES